MTVKKKKGVLIFIKFKRLFITRPRSIYLILVISLICIDISIITMFNASDRETNQDFFSDINNPKSAFELSIDYGEYVTVHATAGSGDRLQWSFSGTNTFVGITVLVLDSTNYANMLSNETYSSDLLSDGSYYSAEGNFNPTYSSTWYFLFWNNDADHQNTYLTYNVEFISGGPDVLLIAIIVGVVLAAAVIVIVVIIYKKKSKKKAALVQEPRVKPTIEKPPIDMLPVEPVVEEPPIIIPPVKPVGVTQSTITEPIKQIIRKANICPTCGSEVESHFCIKCGIDINKPELERKKVIQDIQKVFQASGIRIDLEMLRDILPMDDSEFNRKIFELAERFGFKVELEILHVNKEMKEDFINALIDAL